jgi:hypothetical protein
MSQVWIRLEEAQRGTLPARCTRTGERCITRYARTVSHLPGALEWATWTGLWPLDREDEPTQIVLPQLPARNRFGAVLRRTRDVTVVTTLLGLVGLVALDPGIVEGIATVLLLASLGLHVLTAVIGYLMTVEVCSDVSGEWVRLRGVHPDFVRQTKAITTRPTSTPELPDLRIAVPGQTVRTTTPEATTPGAATPGTQADPFQR